MAEGLSYHAPLPVGAHHIATELTRRGEKIAWIGPHRPMIDRKGRFTTTSIRSAADDGVTEIIPATLTPSRDQWPLDGRAIARYWAYATVPSLRTVLARKGFHRPDLIWLSQSSNALAIAHMFPKTPRILRLSDLYEAMPGKSKAVEYALPELMALADLIVATSTPILEALPRKYRSKAELLPNGVDLELFARTDLAAPSCYGSRPIVIFAGGIGSWVDVEVLETIADWSDVDVFVLGRLADETPLPRKVKFVPNVPYTELPRWFAHAQVGIVPFVDSRFTRAVSSNKVMQYLGAGLPVVTLNLPDSRDLEGVCHTTDRFAFTQAVRAHLEQKPGMSRTRQNHSINSWKTRVDTLMSQIAALI